MIKVHFDEKTGEVKGAYDPSVTNPPRPFISVSRERWLSVAGKILQVVNGEIVAEDPPKDWQAEVVRFETVYNLPRPVRTALLLAREAGQPVDEELMSRVDEIEALAAPLRTVPK